MDRWFLLFAADITTHAAFKSTLDPGRHRITPGLDLGPYFVPVVRMGTLSLR